MSARGKGYVQDWDPMRDDYDNSAYDPQYPDDNSSGYVNLDHCRLYITNIPKGLSNEGISVAFSKFGSLTEVFVSKDPEKRYGLVGYETPGEAKLAMMKLNRTEPLRLNISLAHKKKTKTDNRDRVMSSHRDRGSRSFRDDCDSVGSRSNHRRQDLANGDNMEDLVDADVGLNNSLDPDTNLELEHLRLEHLKLQEAQVLCKHRMLLLKQAEKKASAMSRCILPDGRIIVRSLEKSETVRDNDNSFGAGAGDSRFTHCVVCGERAEAFCAACGLTPYCSPACQGRDWPERHRKVCHNLKRASDAGGDGAKTQLEPEPELAIPAAAPLRRPRSPDVKRDRGDEDAINDKVPPRKFGPPGSVNSAPTRGGDRGARGGANRSGDRFQDRNHKDKGSNRTQDDKGYNRNQEGPNRNRGGQNNRSQEDRPNRERNDRYRQNRDAGGRSENAAGGVRDGGRKQAQDDEEWGVKPEPKQEEPLPKPSFKPKPDPQLVEPKLQPKTVPEAKAPEAKKELAPAPVAPARVLVPKNYLIDLLNEKDTVTLSVDAVGSECRAGAGAVCLSLHPEYTAQYMQLLEDDFTRCCEAGAECERKPGVTFVYLNPEDGGWYRARFLAPTCAALLDASKLVAVTPADKCRVLPAAYADLPEFCCQLQGANVQISDNITCTILAKNKDSVSVSIVNNVTNAPMGSGTVKRWEPEVDYPPEPVAKPASAANNTAVGSAAASGNVIPEVPRPPVTNNSKVVLIDATEPSRLFVRDAGVDQQKEFDDVVTEVALYGAEAAPLKEPPVKGQTVVAKFTDGVHYRALCRRVNSKLNKYLLEYIEFGNAEVQFLEDLYPCPPSLDLKARPTLVARAALPLPRAFTPAAQEYLDRLKNDVTELALTIPSGEKSAPSGSAVRLCVANTGEDVNRAVTDLCTPEWVKLLERGDLLKVEPLFFKDIEYVDLPAEGGELEIVDASILPGGVLAGHARGAPHAARAFALADELAEYCNSALCKDPYLPRVEELCVAFCPIKKQWLRAALLQQDGPGGAALDVLVFDYGHIAGVRAAALRKMLPAFVRARPAAVCTLELAGFPKEPTEEQLEKARRHMNLNAQGRGTLRATRATRQDLGEYLIDAPDLLRAMGL